MKVKYNHQYPFAHRFISHMEQLQAQDILRKSIPIREVKQNSSKQQYHSSKKKIDYFQANMTPQETKILTQFNHNRQPHQRNQVPLETRFADIDVNKKKVKKSDILSAQKNQNTESSDIILKDFLSAQMTNAASLKQGYLRLWYQRMALDNNFSSLAANSRKKDDMINQLRQELGQKSGHQAPMFFNPHIPAHSHSQNKTAVMNNQSTTLQSHSIPNQPSASGLGHWNSLHPTKTFNVGTTRSNA